LLNGTSALFRLLLPSIFERKAKQMRHVKYDLKVNKRVVVQRFETDKMNI